MFGHFTGDANYTPKLPPLSTSPRIAIANPHFPMKSLGAAFDSRDVQIRKLQSLNLTPRLGGAGRIGQLPYCGPRGPASDRPIARTNKFTMGFVEPRTPRPKADDEPLSERELAAKARRDRVAALMAERREQLGLLKARAADEERRRREARARRAAAV